MIPLLSKSCQQHGWAALSGFGNSLFWPHPVAWGILVPRPGKDPVFPGGGSTESSPLPPSTKRYFSLDVLTSGKSWSTSNQLGFCREETA